MPKVTYNKLVRDQIPEIMTAKGLAFETRTMDDDEEFSRCLLAKLAEEAQEAMAASSQEELVTELADLAEVVRAIGELKNISPVDIETVRAEKAKKRGAFAKRLLLVWGESD
jgi:predicted house-cleaning noncanonical NTP pyrophosphatase (MazG superfamily)